MLLQITAHQNAPLISHLRRLFPARGRGVRKMTISYSDSVRSLLFRWKGSLYKAVIWDVLLFYTLYYVIFLIQLFALDDQQQTKFSQMIEFFDKGTTYIPLTFLLGFYVAIIVARWWEQFNCISWPHKLMMAVSTVLPGQKHHRTRRLIARWANLQAAIAWRGISMRVIKRFPTMRHLVSSGLMTEHELQVFQSTEAPHGKWFLPAVWICNLIRKAHLNGDMDSIHLKIVMKQLMLYRDGFAMLYVYDWVKIPLVYTQVVTIATYAYFMFCLIARQPKIDAKSREATYTLYVPVFTTVQMLLYMGWLKVGQYLANPFGEDDDDFELNFIMDRNVQQAYMIADDCADQCPELPEDENGSTTPLDLWSRIIPHTRASFKVKDIPPRNPFEKFAIKDEDMSLIKLEPGQNPSSYYRQKQAVTGKLHSALKRRLSPTPVEFRKRQSTVLPNAIPNVVIDMENQNNAEEANDRKGKISAVPK